MEKLNKIFNEITDDNIINEAGITGLARKSMSSLENVFKGVIRRNLSGVVDNVLSMSKELTPETFLQTIRKTAQYRDNLVKLVEELSIKRTGQEFKTLDKVQQEALLTDASKSVKEELLTMAKERKGDLKQDIKNLPKDETGKLSKEAMKNDLKVIDDMITAIKGLPRETIETLDLMAKTDSKVVNPGFLSKAKSYIFKDKNGKVMKINPDGTVKKGIRVIKIAKRLRNTLIVLGIGYVVYELWPDSIVVDEQGNEIMDNPEGTDMNPCLSNFIKNGTGVLKVDTNGENFVFIQNTGDENEQLGGLKFYLDGRVFSGDNSKSGTWSCDGGQISVNESLSLTNIFEQASNNLTPQQLDQLIKIAVDDLDGWVGLDNLKSLLNIVTSLRGKTMNGKNAMSEFIKNYQRDEHEDFVKEVQNVGLRTIGATEGGSYIDQIVSEVNRQLNTPISRTGKTGSGVTKGIKIKWNTPGKSQTKTTTPQKSKTSQKGTQIGYGRYRLRAIGPYTLWSYNAEAIPQVQNCLGLRADGYFGPNTQKALEAIGYNNGFNDDDISDICQLSKQNPTSSTENPTSSDEYLSENKLTISSIAKEILNEE